MGRFLFNLISNPKFIKTHLSKSRLSITNHRLLLGYCVDISPLINYYFNTYSLDFHNENNGVAIDIPTREPVRHISILGSCNGLVCIANTNTCNRETLLWNPVTRKSKILPVDRNVSIFIQWRGYGFGYDQSNDDNKVVMLFSNNLVKIYSLKTGSWRKINDCPHGIYYGLGEYVNGVMYWNVRSRRSSTVILSLNLENETYGKIAQPSYGDGFSAKLSLGVLGGSLSIFCYFDDGSCEKTCVDIWVMKGSGVGDTWIKLYTIPFTADLISGYYPLCISTSGEILCAH